MSAQAAGPANTDAVAAKAMVNRQRNGEGSSQGASRVSTDASPLYSLQRWLLEALVAPGKFDRSAIADTVLPGPMLDAAGCLAIYQRSYILRLRKCLAEQFPATRYALGDALFDDFADTYLRAYPSDSYTLYELGRRFTAWLEETRFDSDRPTQDREDWIDFMVDLACYERELFRLFDAPGHEGQPWPDTTADDSSLILQPCLSLAQYRYPVAWYYHEVVAERSPRFPPQAPLYAVLLRRDYRTTTYPVSALHYRFLTSIQRGRDINAALLEIAEWTQRPIAAVRQSWAAEVRGPWLEAGFFVMRPRLP
jgi:hypothetical protein